MTVVWSNLVVVIALFAALFFEVSRVRRDLKRLALENRDIILANRKIWLDWQNWQDERDGKS